MFGCLLGGVSTIAFAVLMVFIGLCVNGAPDGKLSAYWFVSWGVTQWIGIVPMIAWERSKGHRKGVRGLIVAGCVGLLLSSTCASMIINN